MSLRSVDMQVIIQKTTEVMRNQHDENSKTRLQQQQLAQQQLNLTEIERHQVNPLKKTDWARIQEERDRRRTREGRKGKKKDKDTGQPERTQTDNVSIIDIKI